MPSKTSLETFPLNQDSPNSKLVFSKPNKKSFVEFLETQTSIPDNEFIMKNRTNSEKETYDCNKQSYCSFEIKNDRVNFCFSDPFFSLKFPVFDRKTIEELPVFQKR